LSFSAFGVLLLGPYWMYYFASAGSVLILFTLCCAIQYFASRKRDFISDIKDLNDV
jgi:hypothetical protein